MLPERWQDLIGDLKDKFNVIEHDVEHIDEEGGIDIEFVVFEGPIGLMRLEYVTRPIVLDKKTQYSNRFGAETQISYVYGQEKTHKLDVYKWDEAGEEWVLIDNKNFLI